MTSSSSSARAIKIIDVKDGRLYLDVRTLRQILLQENLKEKKVCVISIAGAFRQGKSFLLNFFIRYLNNEVKNLAKWLDPDFGPITGFSARGGSNAVTTGIWIWSQIFSLKLPSEEEVAVILMDTQGAFDNESSTKDSAVVFALSTLISSVQIYNLKDNINNLSWDCLEYFLNYAELLRETVNQKPFQNLLFLIRDWPDEAEYPYGISGGNEYLNKMLNIGKRNQICNIFNQINCFLLPDPGQVVRKFSYQGKVDELEPMFKEHIAVLCRTILSPNNLIPKVLNGVPINVRYLVNLFENYCQEFNKDDMPEGQTLFEANAKVQHMMAVEEAEKVYDNQMRNLENHSGVIGQEILQQIHESSKIIAVDNLSKKKLIGGDKMKQDSVEELSHKINEKFLRAVEYLRKIEILEREKLRMQKEFEEQLEKVSHLEEEVSEVLKEREKIMEEFKRFLREHDEKIDKLTKQIHEKHGNGWVNFLKMAAQIGVCFVASKLGGPLLLKKFF